MLRFTGRRSGCRAYVALQGGIDVPLVLGARATDLQSGFGGFWDARYRPATRWASGRSSGPVTPVESAASPHATSATLRVVLGPQADYFSGSTVERFLDSRFRLGATSDRVGCRLEGEPLPHQGPAEILSDGMLPGSIQVPPDGQPIVMLNDGPTTGGYPKIATVITADLPLLAQLVPGEGEVRFEQFS